VKVAWLGRRFDLPEGALRWSGGESAFRLEKPVRQYTFNLLVHALPYRVVGESVKADEAWLGPFAEDRALSDDCGQWDPDELLAPGPDAVGVKMFRAIRRLRGITGFVTTLHAPVDPRPLAFARYFHVQRVVRVAEWLWSRMESVGAAPDRTAVLWLAWAHDLNRWPFAHNSEKGYFDQARDVARYMLESASRCRGGMSPVPKGRGGGKRACCRILRGSSPSGSTGCRPRAGWCC
jgi:hypothetical protein